MKRKEIRAIMLTQKFDCRCFYRTSKTNKKAKRTSNRLVRRELRKRMNGEITQW